MNRSLLLSLWLFFGVILSLAGCGSSSDGEYSASVSLTGGSGRAYIEDPCRVVIKNEKATADIIWSSSNYDYMIVHGKTYYPVNTEGGSEFVIPVELDCDMPIQADTTAMSTPHLIDYTLRISISDHNTASDASDASDEEKREDATELSPPDIPGLEYLSTDENEFAGCYAIHRYSDDNAVISIDDGRDYLIVPKDCNISDDIPEDIIVIHRPPSDIYLAASSVMCRLDAIDAVDMVSLSGLDRDAWYIDSARRAMDDGLISYGGKYSAPDYEKMVMEDIDLAIESTMILHSPKVLEKLQKLGTPVFIDRSSYETHPLGRCEWVKVYGVICDREDKSQEAFAMQRELVDSLDTLEASGKTVAVFSVNSNHQIVTRRKNDYFAKMISMAGGEYLAPDDDDEKANSQTTISMEAFYDYASDADILIYNASIEDVPESLEALLDSDRLFADFGAFEQKNVWYTDRSLYQYADQTGTMIDDLYRVISEDEDDTEFLHRLR